MLSKQEEEAEVMDMEVEDMEVDMEVDTKWLLLKYHTAVAVMDRMVVMDIMAAGTKPLCIHNMIFS